MNKSCTTKCLCSPIKIKIHWNHFHQRHFHQNCHGILVHSLPRRQLNFCQCRIVHLLRLQLTPLRHCQQIDHFDPFLPRECRLHYHQVRLWCNIWEMNVWWCLGKWHSSFLKSTGESGEGQVFGCGLLVWMCGFHLISTCSKMVLNCLWRACWHWCLKVVKDLSSCPVLRPHLCVSFSNLLNIVT